MEYGKDTGTISLSQKMYIKDLITRHAPHIGEINRKYDSPMADDVVYTPEQCPAPGSPEHESMAKLKDTYMSVVGALLWLAACTRPDITFATSMLARFVSNPGKVHYEALQRVLVYLENTCDRSLTLRPQTADAVCVYTDASWSEKFSISGGIIYY